MSDRASIRRGASRRNHLIDLSDKHVIHAIKQQLLNERLSRQIRFEKDKPFTYICDRFSLNEHNSILFEFDTPSRETPEFAAKYKSAKHKLLFITCLRSKANGRRIDDSIRFELKIVIDKHNIDEVVLWIEDPPRDERTTQLLKQLQIHLIMASPAEAAQQRQLSHFERLEGQSIEYSFAVSAIAGVLTRRLKKFFHLVLSEIAAPIYDELYAKPMVATSKFRNFETGLIDAEVSELKRQGRTAHAVDVGCGTGDHAIRLKDTFSHVDGIDFSPLMIRKAMERKPDDCINLQYHTADIEHEKLPLDEQLRGAGGGNVDLIIASFGMGSFVEDSLGMLRRFHGWLREDGIAVISFYNAQAFGLQVTPNWRDSSLNTQLDVDSNTLRVRLTPKTRFDIFCKPFSEEISSQIKSIFEVKRTTTYPTLMSLMPNSLLQNEVANKVFHHVDGLLADQESPFQFGHYVTVVVRKPKQIVTAQDRVLGILKSAKLKFDLIQHGPVGGVDDVLAAIKQPAANVIKTIVFSVGSRGGHEGRELVAAITFGDRRINKKALASAVGTTPNRLRFASERAITELGFPPGGLAPFGFGDGFSGRLIVDAEVMTIRRRRLYMAAGVETATLRISSEDFKKIISQYEKVGGISVPREDLRQPPA